MTPIANLVLIIHFLSDSQALEINDKNHKAQFRKAKALGALGYFDKAEPILTDLLYKNTAGKCSCYCTLSIYNSTTH